MDGSGSLKARLAELVPDARVARKLDELLTQPAARSGFGRTAPGELRTDTGLLTPVVRDGFRSTAPGDLTDR